MKRRDLSINRPVNRQTNRGFSLIEALITLLVVMLGLLGAARLQVGLLAASADAKARDEASAFAQDRLSVFQSVARYTDYRDAIIPGSVQRQGLLHHYRIEWNVEHCPEPDFKRVDIQVRWPADNPVNSIRIQSLIPGLEPARFARQQLPPATP